MNVRDEFIQKMTQAGLNHEIAQAVAESKDNQAAIVAVKAIKDFLSPNLIIIDPNPAGHKNILNSVANGPLLKTQALDGKCYLFTRFCLFNHYINFDLIKYNNCQATLETFFEVYEMKADGDVFSIFRSFAGAWENKIFSQCQVVEICQKFPQYLEAQGFANIFLVKIDETKTISQKSFLDNLGCLMVFKSKTGLGINSRELSNKYALDILGAKYQHRVFAPAGLELIS